MSAFVRNFTILLAMASLFAGGLLPYFADQISSLTELRWTLVIGMPTLLFVSFVWFDQTPAKTLFAVALQSLSQLALFLVPYWWLASHAQ